MRMNKGIFIGLLLIFELYVSQSIHGQNITLVGQVQDVFLKRPLVAKISVYETDSTTCVLDSVHVEVIEDDDGSIMIAPYYAPVKAALSDSG